MKGNQSKSSKARKPLADALRVDGNAAAGMLSELFTPDLTSARARCAGCNATQAIGTLLVYAHGMGMVARCPSCEGVILRVVKTPTHLWFEATGATSIAVAHGRT
ncbi:MAG TPA: DUF6510 family protein [Gemmatimonadaceae bacterium]|jgi:hypothetical protein